MCIFCKIINQEIPSYKIYEDEYTYAFLDISPLSQGHTLVVPKKHSEHVLEADSATITHCFNTIKKITHHYDNVLRSSGYNIISNVHPSSGQTVFHTHFHIVPRFTKNESLFDSLKEHSSEENIKMTFETIKIA
ncbi:MAG: HIT family protein [Erysipelothrix sp.]|jgi:histidine triad (HIT) family protein|nr:HIT family protein [Erysipelothrix sp.]